MFISEQCFNRFLKVLVVIGIFLTGCQSAPPANEQVKEPIPTIKAAMLSAQTPAVDLTTEMKATRPWRIAQV